MKRLLLITIALLALSLSAQITGLENLGYALEITGFFPSQESAIRVEGTLTMTNDHNQDWQMEFGWSDIAEIWVDGQMPAVMHLPIVTSVTIPAHQSYVANISYSAEALLSEGYHSARAHAIDTPYTPLGNPVQFWIGTIIEDLALLDWTLSLTQINANSVSGILTAHNPTTHLCQIQYNCIPLFFIGVDGSWGEFWYFTDDYFEWFKLDPAETINYTIAHQNIDNNGAVDYSPGVHSAQAKSWHGLTLLGEPVEFSSGPISSQDEHLAVFTSTVYPNPFTASATISVSAPKAAPARISIYNLKGQRLQDLPEITLSAGENQISWQAVDDTGARLPSGIYLIKIVSEGETRLTRAMILN